MRSNDPSGLLNFRTPRFDLDNLYGRGPDDQPYLYDQNDKAKMAIGSSSEDPSLPDLPRYENRALIGDMRNDENTMVSQLQLAFLLAHNTLVDRARAAKIPESEVFESARKTLTWLYQYIVWNDFLNRIVMKGVREHALHLGTTRDKRKKWRLGLKDVYNWKRQPFMPVEFSVAAYRFGHSLVRNSYQTNSERRGFGKFAPIFDNVGNNDDPDDLRGFRPMKPQNMIQWDWFLPMTTSRGPFPQMARKIDTKLSNALSFLHEAPSGDPLNVLAFRNLKRGFSFGLPSGTCMAKKYNIERIKLDKGEPDSLWYYILREAQDGGGNHLGRLGSTVVAAVFAGLLKGDPNSWVNVDPDWTPNEDPLLNADEDNVDDKNWSLASIIRIAKIKQDGIGLITS
ncbi:MAG: peroxidase family protein [Gammaproteobacteria bacterium]